MTNLEQLTAELRATRALQAQATDAHTRLTLEGEIEHIREAIEHERAMQRITERYAGMVRHG